MITVFWLERKLPKYYGLCGLKTQRMVYAIRREPFDEWSFYKRINSIRERGWKVTKRRSYPSKVRWDELRVGNN